MSPKFNQKRWRPHHDTTPGYKTVAPDAIVLRIATHAEAGAGYDGMRPCPCGCGEWPSNRGSIFRMGHDARLRGKLIRAHLTGTDIVYVRGGVGDPEIAERVPAVEVARRYPLKGKNATWEYYLNEAVERREGRNRELLQRALGSKRLISVGRWEYTGQVCAVYRLDGIDMYEVEYVTRGGDVRRKRVPKDETMPALEGNDE